MSSASAGLIIGGVGAALGAIGAAIIQSIGGKSESRAHAADLVVTAASGLMDRTLARDTRLEEENRKLRHALLQMLDVIDQLGTRASITEDNVFENLKAASHNAREAM